MHWVLTIPCDFSLNALLQRSQQFLLPTFEVNQGCLERVEQLSSGRIVLLTISQVPTGLQLTSNQRLTGSEAEELSHKTWRMLRLGENFALFFARFGQDTSLKQYLQPGARFLRGTTLMEDIVKALLLTQPPQEQGFQRITQLVDHLGAPLPSNPTRHAWPPLNQLDQTAAALQEILDPQCVLSLTKAIGVIRTQEADLELLSQPQSPLEAAVVAVNSIPGMNDAALSLTMLALGRYDYLPIDASARERVSKVWYNGGVVTPEKIKTAFSRWHPWEGLVYWLWAWPGSNSQVFWAKERELVHGNSAT